VRVSRLKEYAKTELKIENFLHRHRLCEVISRLKFESKGGSTSRVVIIGTEEQDRIDKLNALHETLTKHGKSFETQLSLLQSNTAVCESTLKECGIALKKAIDHRIQVWLSKNKFVPRL